MIQLIAFLLSLPQAGQIASSLITSSQPLTQNSGVVLRGLHIFLQHPAASNLFETGVEKGIEWLSERMKVE